MRKTKLTILTLVTFLSLYYLVVYGLFYSQKSFAHHKDSTSQNSPVLRARLGTILSHSSDYGGQTHLYCYYPHSNSIYENKSGEYIIKRANNLEDCQGWHGRVLFNEGWWVSEKEKIWWPS